MNGLMKQVNDRRVARGREPVTLAHMQRVFRYLFGEPPAALHPAFQHRRGRKRGPGCRQDEPHGNPLLYRRG